MAQDYARKNRPKSTTRKRKIESKVPAWVWLFTGAVLGAFIMFLMRLSELGGRPPHEKLAQPSKLPSQEKKESEQRPRFDFYELLKETELPISVGDDQPQAQNPANEQAFEYILQVASFKNKKDAEQVRAELILLNLEAQIEKAKIRNGETWHRILVGPFESRSMLSKARTTLVSNDFEALVLKRKLNSE